MARLSAGEAIVEGNVEVRVRGRLRHVFSAGGCWFAQVEFAPSQNVYVPLRAVMVEDAREAEQLAQLAGAGGA